MHRRGKGVGRSGRAGGVRRHTAMRNAEPDWEVILRKGPCSGNPLEGRLPRLLHTDGGEARVAQSRGFLETDSICFTSLYT